MIKFNVDDDSIMVNSEMNAALISVYLHDMAKFLESDLTDEQYGLFCRCSDFLWIIKKDLPEE